MTNDLHPQSLTMRVVVCDDEPLGRNYLTRMLETLGYQVVAEAGNGLEAIDAVNSHKPDLLLLDIRMPEMDGLQCAQILSEMENPPAIIFITAFDQHAVDAFKTQAVGYLVKPVTEEDLASALKRVGRVNAAQLLSLQNIESLKQAAIRKHIAARTYKGIELVEVESIYYFLADQKYVTIRHKGGEVLIDETLKNLEDEFASSFVRIHRNALVAKHYLEGLELKSNGQYHVKIKGIADTVQVSRRHLPDIRATMGTL